MSRPCAILEPKGPSAAPIRLSVGPWFATGFGSPPVRIDLVQFEAELLALEKARLPNPDPPPKKVKP